MRKLLSTLMATAIFALVIAGCSKNSDPYNPPTPTPTPPTPTPTPEETYDQAFKSYVGGTISPNQDWGFSASVVATSAATRGSEQGYYLSDNYPKEYTQAFFKEALDSLPEGQKVGASIKNFEFVSRGPFRFDIVFGYTDQKIEIGYYYYNPDTETYADRKEVKLVGDFQSDFTSYKYIQYNKSDPPSEDQWKNPKPWDGYHTIWDAEKYNAKWVHARMFTLRDGSNDEKIVNPDKTVDVPKGYRVGFYVRNPENGDQKVYTNRFLNKDEQFFFAVLDSKNEKSNLVNAYMVGIEDRTSTTAEKCDQDCNDVMIAVHKNVEDGFPELVIPEKENPTWRVIAEDLSASDNTDFDFNDIVLDVKLTKTGADCILQAAGGQLPIRINGDDDLEVHKKFGVDQKTMVNTNADKKGLPSAKKDPVSFSITGSFSSVKDVKIEVKKQDGKWHELYAKTGDSACKILVDTTFKWPDEQQSIKEVYPKFEDWVKHPTVVWYP